MTIESKLQAEIIRWLKVKGCYVLRLKAGPNYPAGCPDIIFLYEGFWGAIEVKASPKSKYQALQKETLEQLNEWSWAKRVDPTDWMIIKNELEGML